MELASDINRAGYHVREMRVVDDLGRRVTGFGTKVFDELMNGRYVTVGRSDLSRLLFEKLKGTTEVIFESEILDLQERDDCVQVQLKNAGARRFGLVIGADGLHSAVRRLAFGPQKQFERPLGYAVAAFEVRGYRPRDEDIYLMYGQPGRMVGRFTLHDDRTLFLFVFTADGDTLPERLDMQKAMLRQQILRRGVGMSSHSGQAGWNAGTLFRSRQPDKNGKVVTRSRRPYRRCRVLRLLVGWTRLGPCHDFRLRAGR